MTKTHRSIFVTLLFAAQWIAFGAAALEPDEIALIVNSNEPASRELANLYTKARQLPENRILELDLPKTDDISFEDFESKVVPQVRDFLRTGHLENQIKCFVTFYGVPLRIATRVNSAADQRELTSIRQELLKCAANAQVPVANLEAFAAELEPGFQPQGGKDLEHLAGRARDAERSVITHLQSVTDAAERAKLGIRLFTIVEPLAGDGMKVKRLALERGMHPATNPSDNGPVLSAKNDYDRATQAAAKLEQNRFDPKDRADLRTMVRTRFGIFSYVKLLRDQSEYLDTTDTSSAFDSELAAVRWLAYSHVRWCENPMFYGFRGGPGLSNQPPVMVMRLDGPTPDLVKNIITTSIQAELHGLKGKVVLDSRGMDPATAGPKELALAQFDQTIRNLGDLLQSHTSLNLLRDDKPEVLPANSADDVALYCGWYSVHNYITSFKFNPGSVGYHIASFEMVSLHGPKETGWVPRMIQDGISSTLGPVAEPYVQTFPRPDDFFPVLLTGKLTLAETYWKTSPTLSWRMGAIGDPLYNPYKTNPQLAVEDLPERLKPIFQTPATMPLQH